MSLPSEIKFPVFLSGKHFLVWDVEAATKLRTEHRIFGQYFHRGSTSKKSQEDGVVLPLCLSPEEVFCAYEHGWISVFEHLLHKPGSIRGEIAEASKLSIASKEVEFREQIETYLNWKKAQKPKGLGGQKPMERKTLKSSDVSIGGDESLQYEQKAHEPMESKPAQIAQKPPKPQGFEKAEAVEKAHEASKTQRAQKTQGTSQTENVKPTRSLLKLPETCSLAVASQDEFQKHRAHLFLKVPLTQAAQPGLSDCIPVDEERWKKIVFESHQLGKLRCRIFVDLYTKGYSLTSALKFGGDFLVYEKPPDRSHSLFIAIAIPSASVLTQSEIIARGRMAQTVKKSLLFCYPTSENKIEYYVIQWNKE